jgi:hypothetical protein
MKYNQFRSTESPFLVASNILKLWNYGLLFSRKFLTVTTPNGYHCNSLLRGCASQLARRHLLAGFNMGVMIISVCVFLSLREFVHGGDGLESPPYPTEDFTDSQTPSLPTDVDDTPDFADFDWTRNSTPMKTTMSTGNISTGSRRLRNIDQRAASLDQPAAIPIVQNMRAGGDSVSSSLPTVVITGNGGEAWSHNEGASASGVKNNQSM